MAGDIIAGRAVRMSCQRHLKDLERVGWDPEFPYYFDLDSALKIIHFFPMFLTFDSGEPFRLAAWQVFLSGSLFGWKRDKDETRRFRTAYIETGKGSGKTPWVAGVGLYGLCADGEQSAEIYSAATQREQAGIMMRDAIGMADRSPDLKEMLLVGKHSIAFEETGSFFKAVSSEHRGLDGLRPHFALIDELHEHRDGIVVVKIRSGFKARQQPLEIDITNAGHDQTSVCWEHHQRSLDVLEGIIEDETWFSYICQLDPCDECFTAGYRQPRDGCSHCDHWTNQHLWVKTNPSMPSIPGSEYIESQIELAQTVPSRRSWVKRLNFCLWTQSHESWMSADEWAACQVPAISERNDRKWASAAGLDLSAKLDLSACVIALRIDDEASREADEVQIETADDETGDRVQKLTLNYTVELIPFFWLPADTLLDRVRTERIPYDIWEEAGDLRVTAGGAIDYDVIYDTLVGDVLKRYRVTALGYDPREATQLGVQLRDRGRVNIAELQQGRKLSEAFKLLEALVKTRRLRHDGNKVLAWCFENAEPKYDRFGQLWIEKPSGNRRIDGAVAAAMAINQLMLIPQRRSTRIRASVMSDRGIFRLDGR